MTRRNTIGQGVFLLVALSLLLTACNLPAELIPALTSIPASTPTPPSPWQVIAEGLAWRTLLPHDDELAQIVVVRINPQHYAFRVHYRARDPQSLANWRELEPEASVIINANFFDPQHQALGLVVSDGLAQGTAYRERGGTFLVRDGVTSVIANRAYELAQDGSVEQAAQGFPLLVEKGAPAYFSAAGGERTRRTLIAEDGDGNILIMIAPWLGLSLADLSAWLPTTDLAIETAFNLDGGGSTMMALPDADYLQPSFDRVPTILAVYPRQMTGK